MTKNVLNAYVTTLKGNFNFSGDNAAAVIESVRAHKDIHAMSSVFEQTPIDMVIPYSAVVLVNTNITNETVDVEDENCKTKTPPEESSLTIHNPFSEDASITVYLGDTNINGKFGDMTFSNGIANVTIPGEGDVSAFGLADGITYTAVGDGYATHTGTTPDSFSLTH